MTSQQRKPRDEEADFHGVTHPGHVRTKNEDQFLVCTLHKEMRILASSLVDDELAAGSERLAALAMVADGVGGAASGEEASKLTAEELVSYINHSMYCYYTSNAEHEELFVETLRESVLRCHAKVLEEAERNPARAGMATTLTLVIGVWPRAYIVQVGDSRCYWLRDGELTRMTRDQTVAQQLVDAGALSESKAQERWGHVLSSAIGGTEALPVIGCSTTRWGDTMLLCTDGLTDHVPDDRIRERLLEAGSAREACETLLQDALDDGGRDNITIVVVRLPEGA